MAVEDAPSVADLQVRVARLERQVAEAMERQTAMAEVLRVIASSPSDLQAVLDAIVERAARLAGCSGSVLWWADGAVRRRLASWGALASESAPREMPISRASVGGRAILDRESLQIPDLLAAAEEYPDHSGDAERFGVRAVLATPLLREGAAIGSFYVVREEPGPFAEDQVALLRTFADQAVIAIDNARLFSDLQAALDRQTATSEILRVIASSPAELQSVLDAVAENAARLCGADDTTLMRIVGGRLLPVARSGPPDGPALDGTSAVREAGGLPISRESVSGRAVVDRRTVHVEDLAAESGDEFPITKAYQPRFGYRTMLATPLLREGMPLGTLAIRRWEVRPFTGQQIALLETFADQAVIAIENARLFRELEERNWALSEALEQQTATAEILRVISSSPTDLQPVLDAVAERAARLCEADNAQVYRPDGDVLRAVACYGEVWPIADGAPITRELVNGRAILDRKTVHVHDLKAALDEFPRARPLQERHGHRSIVVAPLLREGVPLGAISIVRMEVRPFTEQQVRLLETFADQAVIAIENARLFQDLAESLEQQTATAEVLRVIASTPTDLQRVLETVAENAARLCEAEDASILRVEGDVLRMAATYGPIPQPAVGAAPLTVSRYSVSGRAVVDRQTVHVHDLAAASEAEFPEGKAVQRAFGHRTIVAAPLLREGVPLGVITIRRMEVRPFTDRQIGALQTFADQAAIAVENTRLFEELQDRNRDLTEALEQQTATAEILRVIASSPTDLRTVLDAMAESAARLIDVPDVLILRRDGDALRIAASVGRFAGAIRADEAVPITRGSVSGRSVVERRTVHVHDLSAEPEDEYPVGRDLQARYGHRTTACVPLLREGEAIGTILARRTEVRPFSEQQLALLETFADQAVIAIENTRLFGELQQRVEELQALGEVGQAVSSTLDLQRVLGTVVAQADQLSGTDGGVLYEYDEAAGEFRLRATRQVDPEMIEALRAAPIRLGEGAIGRAALIREPVQIPDIAEGGAYEGRLRDALVAAGHRAVLAVPLLREDRILGGLVVVRKAPGAFPPNVVDLVKTFASQSALAIQNARLYREVEDKSAQLEEVSRHKSEFLANMSHELRTPLNAIIGFSEVLAEQIFGELNERQLEYVNDVLTSGRHLLSLINDILDLSKVEAGRMELELAEFSLREALQNGLTMLRERAGRHGITLSLAVEDGLEAVAADERKVKQVVFNLLSNAVKFTPDGGRVEVSARRVGGAVEVAVRDSGIGIAPGDLPRVFEEFRQVGRGEARREGTGLGLPLAKKLVELQGGSIRVESEPGAGSTFAFSLPQPPVAPHAGAGC